MTLKFGSSITGGFRRIANRNGAMLLGAFTLLSIVWQVTFTSFFVDIALGGRAAESTLNVPPMIDAPTSVLAAGALLSIAALTYLNIVAIRTFLSGATRSIPSDYFTRRIGVVFLDTVVGGIGGSIWLSDNLVSLRDRFTGEETDFRFHNTPSLRFLLR